jgi:mercuric ion binding protein
MTRDHITKETTMKTVIAVAAALLVLASPAWAGPKTITLTVSNMTCATCPITVKRALTKVGGVSKAVVDFDRKQVVVAFDDAKTSAAALIKATTDAGFPAAVKRDEKR